MSFYLLCTYRMGPGLLDRTPTLHSSLVDVFGALFICNSAYKLLGQYKNAASFTFTSISSRKSSTCVLRWIGTL